MIEKTKNIIYDTNYSSNIKGGGSPNVSKDFFNQKKEVKEKKKGFFDRIVDMIFATPTNVDDSKSKTKVSQKDISKQSSLEQQLKDIVNMKDEEYDDKLLTQELRKYIVERENDYLKSLADYKTHIAPSYWQVKPSVLNISGMFTKTYYASAYPSYIDFLWTRDMISFYSKWDMSWFIYPADDSAIQAVLKRRATQLKAQLSEAYQKGITLDTEVEVEYKDVDQIRQKLATREERYFEAGYYITLYNDNEEKLKEDGSKLEQKIAGYGIRIKPATQRMDEGLTSTSPIGLDDLGIYRSMVTTSLAGSFPFISNDLIDNSGILYGINLHSGGLVIFDRFSGKLPNSNSVVLATSGAGKSFTVKLEILRYLLLGIDVIVIDPENEYKSLIKKVGGTYINVSANSNQFINPFDMPPKIEDIEYKKGGLLREQILNLIGLISVLVGGLNPVEEALLDKALQATYALKGITFDLEDYTGKKPPTMADLLVVLEGMEGGDMLAIKISKYVTGTFGNLFNNHTNVDLNTGLTVFSIRDLEDALKTPAMFNILNYIWTKVRSKKTKRLLVVDEAWIMMQKEVSANFLFGLIKRARKYGLGVTTITQDVEDFVKSPYGKPIVSNSSLQILLKQSPASIKSLDSVFGLSDAEKQRLVSANVGEGLFFAGNQHVAMRILASPYERDFITTDVR